MKLLKSKKLYIGLAILFVIGFFIFSNLSASQNAQKIVSVKVKYGTLEDTKTISGEITGEEHVTLRFQTSGHLAWVGVKEGDYVKKYQTIASLDQRTVRKNLQKDLNDYLTARWNLDQASRDTYKDQVITDPIKRIIDKYQFDLNNSVLDVEIQNLAIEYSNLVSPIEGLVVRVDSPSAGVNITPSQAEFEIVNPKTVYFSATADQSDVVALAEKMKGTLILDAYPDASLSGIINNISFIPKTGETGTVYSIKFVFPSDNSDYKYRIGMTGDVTFTVRSKNDVLYIPTKFIKTGSGKKYVMVKRNGKDLKINISTGMETDTDTEITSGLSTGETVYD